MATIYEHIRAQQDALYAELDHVGRRRAKRLWKELMACERVIALLLHARLDLLDARNEDMPFVASPFSSTRQRAWKQEAWRELPTAVRRAMGIVKGGLD